MSTNLPPTGPEYLESGKGGPIRSTRRAPTRGRRTATVFGGVLVGLAAVGGGGFFAWSSFSGVGVQAAEVLPSSTLGYISIDADPSGAQKVEALRTLNKFPALADEIGLTSDGDIKKRIFEETRSDGACEEIDYDDDIDPWLGDRFAAAAVDIGEDEPAAVLVVQVSDAEAAASGLERLQACDDESADLRGGWIIEDGWALVAETTEIAEQVADATDEGTLAADVDFQKWTGEAGEPGILSAYASPAAGEFILETAGLANGVVRDDDLGPGELPPLTPAEIPEEFLDALNDFGGAGLAVRFDDGSLEIEAASSLDVLGLDSLIASDQAGEAISTLPADTAAAFGVGLSEGWFEELLEYASDVSGGVLDLDEVISQIEQETGLTLPEDAETLAGDSLVVAVSSELDPGALVNSVDSSDVPVGVKIKGDAEKVDDVLSKLIDAQVLPPQLVGSSSEGDYLALGPSEDYRQELLQDGGLGGTDLYRDVIREDGLSSVLFVNFDAGDDWLAELVGDDKEVRENFEPLSGLGFAAWSDDEIGHLVLRITTD